MDPLLLILLILLHLFLWFPLILLTGAVLGSWRGGLAILVFLAEGTVALQFLVPGSLMVLVAINGGGVFGGYILSWPVAAYLTGLIYERCSNRRFRTSFLAMLPGSALSFVLTVSWLVVLATLQGIGIAIDWWLLLLDFVVGLVSIVVPSLFAAIVLTNLWKMPRLRQHTFI